MKTSRHILPLLGLASSALFLTLALSTGASAGPTTVGAVQDNGNRDACCLAAEWSAPAVAARASQPHGGRSAAPVVADIDDSGAWAPASCQKPLAGLSCCLGAVWLPDLPAAKQSSDTGAPRPMTPTRDVPMAVAQSDDRTCCLANEWYAR
jgi:hypothetical protein